MAFAEFRPRDPAQCQWRSIQLGDSMPFDAIVQRSRGTGAPGQNAINPWFPGALNSRADKETKKVATVFSFNQGNGGWHYAWQSHRMTRTTEHCLYVFIFAGQKQHGNFTCVSQLSSAPFDIHCRRKRCRYQIMQNYLCK
jgi:hypothetical protein